LARLRRAVGDTMEDARKMGKSELFSHFAERFDMKRTQSREFFDELAALCEKELKRTGEFVIPGMVKLVLKKTNARIVKQLKDAVLPKKTPA
jgi:nucleoid DNA-binding protein